jgi:hypothetical protein
MRDDYEDFDDERGVPDIEQMEGVGRRPILFVIGLLVVMTLGGAWYLRETDDNRDVTGYAGHAGVLRAPVNGEPSGVAPRPAGEPGAVATSGTTAAASTSSAAVIRELETITGAADGHELVGRKVDLHVPVQSRANDVSFWVGEKDNRMLVVMERDRRTGAERQRGEPAMHYISPVHAGQQADIAGSIQKVPYEEAMYSWGLSTLDRRELAERPIYIRADSVTAEGQTE